MTAKKLLETQEKQNIEGAGEMLGRMMPIAELMEKRMQLHEPGGDCFRLAKKVLRMYNRMKFDIGKKKADSVMITLAKREHREGTLVVEDVPPEAELFVTPPPEYTVADIEELFLWSDQYDFTQNQLMQYIRSCEISFEMIICFCVEKIMERIREQDESAYRILDATYIDEKTAGMTSPELLKHLNMANATYYSSLRKAISLFSSHLFTPMGGNYRDKDEDTRRKYIDFCKSLETASEKAKELLEAM